MIISGIQSVSRLGFFHRHKSQRALAVFALTALTLLAGCEDDPLDDVTSSSSTDSKSGSSDASSAASSSQDSSTSDPSSTSSSDSSSNTDIPPECTPGPGEVVEIRGLTIHAGNQTVVLDHPLPPSTALNEITHEIVWRDSAGTWQVRPLVEIHGQCAKATDVPVSRYLRRTTTVVHSTNGRRQLYRENDGAILDARIDMVAKLDSVAFDATQSPEDGVFARFDVSSVDDPLSEIAMYCPDYGALWDTAFFGGLVWTTEASANQAQITRAPQITGPENRLEGCRFAWFTSETAEDAATSFTDIHLDRELLLPSLTLPAPAQSIDSALASFVTSKPILVQWPLAAAKALMEPILQAPPSLAVGAMIWREALLKPGSSTSVVVTSSTWGSIFAPSDGSTDVARDVPVPILSVIGTDHITTTISGTTTIASVMNSVGPADLTLTIDSPFVAIDDSLDFAAPVKSVISDVRVAGTSIRTAQPDLDRALTLQIDAPMNEGAQQNYSIYIRRGFVPSDPNLRGYDSIRISGSSTTLELPEGLPLRESEQELYLSAMASHCAAGDVLPLGCATSTYSMTYADPSMLRKK